MRPSRPVLISAPISALTSVLTAGLLLALPACQSAAQNQVAESAGGITTRKIDTVKQEFEYRSIAAPEKIFDTPLGVAQHFVGNFPAAAEGRPLIDLKVGRESESASRLTILITTGGYLDDATYGEQWRIRITAQAQTSMWRVTSAEHRFRCGRSGVNSWSIEPCP